MVSKIRSIGMLVLLLVGPALTYGQDADWKLAQIALTNFENLEASTISRIQLSEALERLEKKFDVSFMYSTELLEGTYVPSDVGKTDNLYSELRELLEPLNLKYSRLNNRTFAISVDLAKYAIVAQERLQHQVEGTVTDAQTGESLPGVNVVIKGTSTGTATDGEGNYSLEAPAGQDTLVFSFIGFQTQEIPIDGRTEIDVQLQSQALTGEEVVMVGYGTQSTRQLSSSVSNIRAEDLEDQPVGQLAQKLQGKVSGAQISQTTGIPGEGMKIRIRGAASITAGSDPLYVVDGNPIVGDISNLNPNEIESISVLKDASATSLYGSRAANGVVLIETKNAVSGETRVDYNGYAGVQQVPQRGRPNMMNAREFATFRQEIAEFRGQPVDSVFQDPGQYGEGTDWDEAITEVAPIQNHSLTMSTGSENFSTTATVGYFKQDGVIVGTGYDRYSLRVNSTYQPNDKLNVGLNVAPTRTENSNSSGLNSNVNRALITSPLAPLRNPDGSLTLTATSPGMFPNPNWVRTLQDRVVDNNETRILANLFLEYELVDGLSVKTSGNIDKGDSRSFIFNGTTTGGLFSGLNIPPNSSLNEGNYLSWVNENTLNYQTDIGDHSVDVLLGFTAQKFRNDLSTVNADDYPDDKVTTIGAAGTVNANSSVQEWGLISYLARLNYN